jgi:hypothetical protein
LPQRQKDLQEQRPQSQARGILARQATTARHRKTMPPVAKPRGLRREARTCHGGNIAPFIRIWPGGITTLVGGCK